MDPSTEEKKEVKLSKQSKAFVPNTKLHTTSHEFHPTTTTHLPTQEAVSAELAQPAEYVQPAETDQPAVGFSEQQYQEYIHFYMSQGYSQNDAIYFASQYIGSQGYYPQPAEEDPANDYTYCGQQEGAEYAEAPNAEDPQFLGEAAEGEEREHHQEESRYRKPQGYHKGTYQGKHHGDYDGSEDGFYDDFGFYYLPGGDYYDPDGFYFNKKGYDKFGGYYDDNLVYVGPYAHKGKKGGHSRYYEAEYELGGFDDYYDEGEEKDKYNKNYIEFVLEQKYYENLEYLKKSRNENFYLIVGNLAESVSKQDLLTFFNEKGVHIKHVTIVMEYHKSPTPVARLEIYDKNAAIQVLKL